MRFKEEEKGILTTVIRRTGSYLLSRALRRSTMGDEGFNGRVRNGIGWDTFAITTSSSNHCSQKKLKFTYLSKLFIR